MATREKGVQTAPCPSCGKELNAIEQPDGSTAYEPCSKCHRPPTKAAKQQAAKEVARETGTAVTGEEKE